MIKKTLRVSNFEKSFKIILTFIGFSDIMSLSTKYIMSELSDKIVFVAEQDAIEKVELELYALFQDEFFPKYITVTFSEEALEGCVEKFIEESIFCEVKGKTLYKFLGFWAHIKTEEFETIMEDFAKPNFKKLS